MGSDIGVPHLVVGIGEILWDLLPDGRQLGGAPANFAFHARALGTECANRVAAYVCSRKGAWPELPSELAAWDRP
jgi:sugar/nucleoside kinase (ribokinase family)